MSSKDYIFIKKKAGVIKKINHKDIIYIQADGDYIKIFTDEEKYYIHFNLNQFHQLLPQDIFYRCHRSFVVNTDRIDIIEEYCIYSDNQNRSMILIGEKFKPELLKLINYIHHKTYKDKL